jgi:hypothetical protein
VASDPAAGDWPRIEAAALAALGRGDDVALFLMAGGLGYALTPAMQRLGQAGALVTLCAMDAEAAGLDCKAAEAAGIILGSQHDHARLLRDSDQLLSFT